MRSKVMKNAVKIAVIAGAVAAVVITAVLLTMAVTGTETKARTKPQINSQPESWEKESYDRRNLIRFHVVANSDSEKDQALKIRIKDLIVQRMTPEFAGVQNINQARQIASAHLEEIKNVARNEVLARGENYPVQVRLGKYDFPVKTYGQLTLPAGNYEAVRIVLGRGQGANWWCVLFPPLCFVDVSKGLSPADQDYTAFTAHGEAVPVGPASADLGSGPSGSRDSGSAEPGHETVKVKFKLLELLGWSFD